MFCYIYKLIKKDATNDDMVYIGSSCNPDQRWQDHKKVCKNLKYKDSNKKVYNYIRENGGINEWELVILDEFEIPLINCVERDKYEKEYILKYDATNKLNINLTGRTKKGVNANYYKKNVDKLKEKGKKYREENRLLIREKSNKYNSEKVICPICGNLSTRGHLLRHQKGNNCKAKECV